MRWYRARPALVPVALALALATSLLPAARSPALAETTTQSGWPGDRIADRGVAPEPVSDAFYDLGEPTSEGASIRVSLSSPTDQALVAFSVRGPDPRYLAIFVGDQWYDVDATLYRGGPGLTGASPILVLDRSERRLIQFVRPEDVLLPSMPPGEYLLALSHKAALRPELAGDFLPGRDVLVRVAAGYPLCALTPPNDPGTGIRPDDALYQLGLSVEPAAPGGSSLLTFTAVVSPPFTDLFDYTWLVDGATVPGATGAVLQQPLRRLQPTPDGRHTIAVVARGAREYRDPTEPRFSHLPLDGGTLTATCTFGPGG